MNKLMEISRRVLALVVVLAVAGASSPVAHATKLSKKVEVQHESYQLKQAIYASSRPGELGEPLGYIRVCARLARGKTARNIRVTVSFPESGQILDIRVPFTASSDGGVIFDFADDAWGNSGHGTLKRFGAMAQLDIEQTGGRPDADKNVRRNYGRYLLSKGKCHG